MDNATLVMIWAALGALCGVATFVMMYRVRKRQYATLFAEFEQEERLFWEGVRARGVLELRQTESGQKLWQGLAQYTRPTQAAQIAADSLAIKDNAEKLALLRKVRIFKAVDEANLLRMTARAEFREYPAGDIIFAQDTHGTEVFIVESGQVSLYRESTKLEIRQCFAQDFFGEMAALSNQPRSATARAITKTKALVLDRETFLHTLHANPQIPISVLQELSSRILKIDIQAEKLVSQSNDQAVKEIVMAFWKVLTLG